MYLDTNGSGEIEYNELQALLRRDDVVLAEELQVGHGRNRLRRILFEDGAVVFLMEEQEFAAKG